jgi:hypothetical protein
MTDGFRRAAVALGLTTICLAELVEPLVRSSHDSVYHWSGPARTLFGPVAVDYAILFILFTALLRSARSGGRWRSLVWGAVILFLPWVILHEAKSIWPSRVPHWFRLPPFYVALIALAVLTWFWGSKARAQREEVIDVAATILAFTALSGVFFASQLLWFWWQAGALNQPLPLHRQTTPVAATQNPRIIWIIMDELSYRQVYGHRYAGLQLPAFDRLAAESTLFTQVEPAANFTEIAIPSLLTGRRMSSVSSTGRGALLIRAGEGARLQPFDEWNTVFEDALGAGYRTAVAGWYNPYCRILHDVLDECYWTDNYTVMNGLDAERSFRSNLVTSADTLLHAPTIRNAMQRFLHIPADMSGEVTGAHVDDYRDLRGAGDRLLSDPSLTFTFLHVPIPHPDGIYDRGENRLTRKPTTYIDNLALADRYLSHVRKVLEKTGQWDSSTILLMGDHGWRTTLIWEKSPEWTEEEERASLGGTFDHRPAYIVKLAGQTAGARIDRPFDAVRTRSLVDELLAGRVRTFGDLKAWVANQTAAR